MEILGKGRAAEVLLSLLEGPMHMKELHSRVGGSTTTLELRVRELIDEGLIEEEVKKDWPFRRVLRLTERGKVIAEFLRLLRSLYEDKIPKKREEWLLLTLYAVGGEVRGSTRLEKLLFLLRHELGIRPENYYEFVPYKHGPFSSDLLKDARELSFLGFIEIEERVLELFGDEEKVIRIYRLTEKGKRFAEDMYNKLSEEVKKALKALMPYNSMPLKSLLDYVYTRYPKFSLTTFI